MQKRLLVDLILRKVATAPVWRDAVVRRVTKTVIFEAVRKVNCDALEED
jgi:hypothetical protein